MNVELIETLDIRFGNGRLRCEAWVYVWVRLGLVWVRLGFVFRLGLGLGLGEACVWCGMLVW